MSSQPTLRGGSQRVAPGQMPAGTCPLPPTCSLERSSSVPRTHPGARRSRPRSARPCSSSSSSRTRRLSCPRPSSWPLAPAPARSSSPRRSSGTRFACRAGPPGSTSGPRHCNDEGRDPGARAARRRARPRRGVAAALHHVDDWPSDVGRRGGGRPCTRARTTGRPRPRRGRSPVLGHAHLLVGPTPAEEGLRRCAELLAGSPGPLRSAAVGTLEGALRGMVGDADEARRLVRRGRERFRSSASS